MRKEKHRTCNINKLSKQMRKKKRTRSFAYGDVIAMDDVIGCPKCPEWSGTLREYIEKHKPQCNPQA